MPSAAGAMLLIFAFSLLYNQVYPLTITIASSSSSPNDHDVSIPITFTCNAAISENTEQLESNDVEYKWFKWCSVNDEFMLLSDETSSTLLIPLVTKSCWDGVQCNVTDSNDNKGSAFTTLPKRKGVGFGIENNQVLNNSIVLTNTTESFGTVYCMAAVHSPRQPYWIAPDGQLLHTTTQEYFIDRGSNGSAVDWVSLSVGEGLQPGARFHEGLYQCIIQDDSMSDVVLQAWIFHHEKYQMSQVIDHYVYALDILQIICAFQGAPGSINWYINEELLNPASSNYTIDTKLVNHTGIVYISILLITDISPLQSLGDYSCRLTTNVVRQQNQWKAETDSTSFYFIVQPVGQHYSIQCPIPSITNTHVWVTENNVPIILPQLNNGTALTIDFNPIKDTHHNAIFGCHSDNTDTLTFTIVGIEPPTSTILSVSFPHLPIVSSGHAIDLSCTAVKLNMGFTLSPDIFWLDSMLSVISNTSFSMINETASTSTLSIAVVKASDAGLYSCASSLDTLISPNSPIFDSEEEVLAVRMEAPSNISITLQSGGSSSVEPNQLTLHKGTAAVFVCRASISPNIDINITVNTTWYTSSGSGDSIHTQEVASTAENIHTTSDYSLYHHESQLPVSVVQASSVGNSIGCNVLLVHNPDTHRYLVDNEAIVFTDIVLIDPSLSINIQPEQVSVINIPPYNSFTLTCTVDSVETLVVHPSVSWSLNDIDLTGINGYTMTTTNATNDTMQYVLTYSSDDSLPEGQHEYFCTASLILINDTTKDYSSSVIVIVKEPTHPNPLFDVVVLSINSQSAVISWLVSLVSYGPESYIIRYGTDEDNKPYDTPPLKGNNDITLQHQIYSLTLRNLQPNTTYYYNVLATNKFSTVTTNQFTFRTPDHSLSIEIPAVPQVVAGSSQSLVCITQSNASLPNPVITWLSHDMQVMSNSSMEWTILPQVNTLVDDSEAGVISSSVTVVFPVVVTSHGGLYTCRAVSSNGETLEAAEYLMVKLPKPSLNLSVFSLNNYDGIYTGHDVTITCTANLSPFINTNVTSSVKWTHSGQKLLSGDTVSIVSKGLMSTVYIEGVNQTHSGIYSCETTLYSNHGDIMESSKRDVSSRTVVEEVIIPVTTSQDIELNVQDLPPHHLTVTDTSSIMAGHSAILTCNVSSLDSLMDTLLLKWTGPKGAMVDASFTRPFQENWFILNLDIRVVKASDGGKYFCHAKSELYKLGLTQETVKETTIAVTLPPLTMAISLNPSSTQHHYAGSPLSITCTIEIPVVTDIPFALIPTWSKDTNTTGLPNTTRISTIPVEPYNTSLQYYTHTLRFSTLSKMVDSGDYHCLVLLTPVPLSPYTTPSPPAETSVTITVLDPPLSVTVSPSIVSILDVHPYNQFDITCQVWSPVEVQSPRKIIWRTGQKGSGKMSTIVGTNIPNVTVLGEEMTMDGSTLVSSVEGSLDRAGEYHFCCDGFIDIMEDVGPTGKSEAITIVNGPAVPLPAHSLNTTRGSSIDSAVVSWSVSNISYTPEDYTVVYGETIDNMNLMTTAISSGPDIHIINASYSALIEDLTLGQRYFYQIVSKNIQGVEMSDVMNFTAGFNRLLLLLRLNGVHRCNEWIFTNAQTKITDIRSAISNVIRSNCNCDFMADLISDSQFVCDNEAQTDVLYYGYIYQTSSIGPEDLLAHLTQWTASEKSPSLVVNSVRLFVKNQCQVNSSDETICQVREAESSQNGGGVPQLMIYLIAGGCVGGLIALICVCLVICIVLKFHRRAKESKEESMRMREIIRASSLPTTLSPIQTNNPNVRSEHYTAPKPYPVPHYPQTPPPNYQSPRSSILGKPPPAYKRSKESSKERDSHIYHLNMPPLTAPNVPPELDPVYEQLPDVVEGNYQTPRRFFPPNVPPPRPMTRQRTASRDTLDRLSTKQEELKTDQSVGRGGLDPDEEDCDQEACADYVEMNSVDFSVATL